MHRPCEEQLHQQLVSWKVVSNEFEANRFQHFETREPCLKTKRLRFNFLQRWKNNCPFGCLSGNQNTYTILLCRALSCCDCKADKQPWHHCQKILIHNRFQYRLKDRAHQPGTHKVALLPFHMQLSNKKPKK